MDNPARSGSNLTRSQVTAILKELPAVYERIHCGMIEIGSIEHIEFVAIIDSIHELALSNRISKREASAIFGVISGMTAAQSKVSYGGVSKHSVNKLRSRGVEKVREALNDERREGT